MNSSTVVCPSCLWPTQIQSASKMKWNVLQLALPTAFKRIIFLNFSPSETVATCHLNQFLLRRHLCALLAWAGPKMPGQEIGVLIRLTHVDPLATQRNAPCEGAKESTLCHKIHMPTSGFISRGIDQYRLAQPPREPALGLLVLFGVQVATKPLPKAIGPFGSP